MARHPVPGRVKTRLARSIGSAAACALQRAFILDLADRLHGLPYRVTWAYAPASAPFRRLLPGARCRPQRGRDLGARMQHAIHVELRDAGARVVVIGSDVPTCRWTTWPRRSTRSLPMPIWCWARPWTAATG